MQDRRREFLEKTEKLRIQVRQWVDLGKLLSETLESKTQNLMHNLSDHEEFLDRIQDQYSKFMFALMVIAADAPTIQRMSNTLDKMVKIFSDPKQSETVDWMAARRKLYQYSKKTALFEEAMLELIFEYEVLAALPDVNMRSILQEIPQDFQERIRSYLAQKPTP